MRPTMLGVIASVIMSSGNPVVASDSVRVVATLRGEMTGDHLGRSMAGVGDVDGDGLADFLVGDARGQYGTHPGQRRCHLYFGKPHLSSAPDVVLEQPEVYSYQGRIYDDMFGVVVDGGRDINGDEIDDFVITSPEWFWGTGKVYLYHGGSFPSDESPAVGIAGYGSSWMTLFWATMLRAAMVGDVNRDGYAELACLVGPATRDVGAYIYFGGAPMDSVHDLGLQGSGSLVLGSCLASGDLDGDGYADMVVGTYGGDPDSEESDAAWVFFGGPSVDPKRDLRLRPFPACVGVDACVPGDVNGDGMDDLLLCVDSYQGGIWITLFFGGAPMDSICDFAAPACSLYGDVSDIAGGDINRDGYADLLVSAANTSDWGYANPGKFSVWFGGETIGPLPDLTVEGPRSFGETVAFIGDMTGDGWPEFAVSNPQADGGRGEIYLYTMGPVSAPPAEVSRALALRIAPNPAVGHALVSFFLSRPELIRLGAYDAGGRLTELVCDGFFGRGSHSVRWSTHDLPSGVYVIRVESEAGETSQPVVLR